GRVSYGPQTKAEQYNRRFRRSLFAAADIKKGEKLTPANVRSVRPAAGLATKHYDEIIGQRAATDIKKGTPFSKRLIAS
ncbi:MAG: SAF domain-containing protein, partial [Patescibacteria group bacterium]